MLHPLRSELNWPLGDRHPLDFAPLRWELPAYLLDTILNAYVPLASSTETTRASKPTLTRAGGSSGVIEVSHMQKLVEALADGLESKFLQRVPHLVLLSLSFYHSVLKPILARLLLGWLRRQGLVDVTDEQV